MANPDKIHSSSAIPEIPVWYEDVCITCKDCGKSECWTARQQQWWYEVAGGEIETTAVRCRACRSRKRTANAESTKRLREHRQARAEKRAAGLAEKLAAKGPEGFAVLDTPVSELPLRKRTLSVLENAGLQTAHDLVAHDCGVTLRGLYPGDLKLIRTLLEKLGLTFIGARVPRV